MEAGIIAGMASWENPIINFMRILAWSMVLMPMFVFVSSLIPWRHAVEADFDEPKEGMIGYTWMSGILIVIALLTFVPGVLALMNVNIPNMPGIIIFLALFCMPLLFFAYLKRVIFNPYMRRYVKEIRRQKKLEKAGIAVKAETFNREEVIAGKKPLRGSMGSQHEEDAPSA